MDAAAEPRQWYPDVLVDGVAARAGGSLTFLTEQIAALDALGRFRLTVFASADAAERLTGLTPLTRVIVTRRRPVVPRLFWEQTVLAWRARRFDAVYMPANFALFGCPRPQLLALQNALHFGDVARDVRRKLYSRSARVRLGVESILARWSVRRADRVLTISQSLADAVTADVRGRAAVEVVLSGTPALLPATGTRHVQDVYVLAVANDSPNKDWDGLIEAFLTHRELPQLVLVGASSDARLAALRRQVAERRGQDRIRLLGHVSNRQTLADLYAGAACYVAHSFLESFGLTPYEALGYGVPVVASSIPAHVEVCGERAAYYDPGDSEALARAVSRALIEPDPSSEPANPRTWSDSASDVAALLTTIAGPMPTRIREFPSGGV